MLTTILFFLTASIFTAFGYVLRALMEGKDKKN